MQTKLQNKFLKHPLLIFIILGALTFFVYTEVGKFIERKNKKIYISNAQLEVLREDFSRTWNRQPTEKEMQNQIYGHVMDQIFYNEAVTMGLDQSDVAVKKRLRQLIEMMLDDYTSAYASEEQLREYLSNNPDKFREEPSCTFSQIYFKVDEKELASQVLEELKNGSNPDKFNEYALLMLPRDFLNEPKVNVTRKTGKEFTEQLVELEQQQWQGPIASVYGWHLVWVEQIEAGKVPDLNSIWDEVEREWAAEQKKKRKEEQYRIMRQQYKIEFEDSERTLKNNS